MKKIISVVLALAMACSMMSLTAFADSLKGDVNGDDNVSAVDARIILRYVAGLYIPDNTDSYDVNGDGNISAVDARIVLRIVAGLEKPVTPPQDNEEPETPPQDNEKPVTPPQDNEEPETPPQDNEKPVTPPQDNEEPETPPQDNEKPVTPPQDNEEPETPPQDNEKPEIPSTDEEKLEKFVELMNSVKTDASAVTLVSTTMYECQEPVVGFALSGLISKEELAESIKDSYGTEEVNETYTGDDIAAAFPPTGTTCSLTMNDIKSIEVKEGLTSYTYVVVVKGEKNPTRGKGVGAVATIVTQEDLQASIDENEDLKGFVTMDAVYKDVTVTAEVDKETGKIIRYTADAPLVMNTNMAGQFAFSVGLGIIENWTITY